MPRIAYGQEGDRERTSGKLKVRYNAMADKLSTSDNHPPQLRVIFDVEGSDETVNLGIPLSEEAGDKLRPLIPNLRDIPTSEKGLRSLIERHLRPEPFYLANVVNGWVWDWLADLGDHRGYLVDLRLNINKDTGEKHAWFTLENEDGFTSAFPAPYPNLICISGETGDDDGIGPEKELNPNKGLFYHLIQLGLDWGKFISDMKKAPALYPRLGLDGPEDPYFKAKPSDSAADYDLCPDFLRITKEHNLQMVKWTVHMHPTYHESVKRGRIYFDLTPIELSTDPNFAKEVEVFGTRWDSLTIRVLQDDNARFLVAGSPGKDTGMTIAKGILVPVVHKWPELVRLHREDGTPRLPFPITPKGWRLNGLAVLGFLAKRLLALDDETLFKVVNLTDPASLLAWAEENVPELSDDMSTDEEVEL